MDLLIVPLVVVRVEVPELLGPAWPVGESSVILLAPPFTSLLKQLLKVEGVSAE